MNRSLWLRHERRRRLPVILTALLMGAAVSLAAAETNGIANELEPFEATNGASGLLSNSVPPVETNATDLTATFSAPARPPTEKEEQTLRSYLEVQAKLHSTLLAIEQARQEANAASASNTATLTERLRQLENGLAAQRDRERDLAVQANRTLLIAAGGFAALGIVALALVVFFQMRGMNRLAEIATALPAARTLGMGLSLPAPGSGSASLPALPGVDGDSARLLGVITRLEERIKELEQTARSQPATSEARDSDASPAGGIQLETADRIRTLMGQAETLADRGQASDAVKSFDQVLSMERTHRPALIGKAKALEKLGRLTEAVACSDEALTADPTLTQAWLIKARLLHQLGQDADALNCYEHALAGQSDARSGD